MTSSKVSETTSSPSSSENASNLRGHAGRRLIAELADTLREDPFWSVFFREHAVQDRFDWALHVAIFQEPFLTWVFEGRKRVESRFSQNQVAPFGDVHPGDVIALKRVGGPIVGVCLVNAAWSYRLDPKTWSYIRERFAPLLCTNNEEFWASRQEARFATLISIARVQTVSPIEYLKADRRGWLVAHSRVRQQVLDL